MNYALAGKVVVVWLIIAAFASPVIGRLIARRKAQSKLKELYAREVERQREILRVADSVVVDGLFQSVATELSDRQRYAREAVVPISDRVWSDARAFMLDEPTQPRRAS